MSALMLDISPLLAMLAWLEEATKVVDKLPITKPTAQYGAPRDRLLTMIREHSSRFSGSFCTAADEIWHAAERVCEETAPTFEQTIVLRKLVEAMDWLTRAQIQHVATIPESKL